jgi:hypothetical protein
MDALSQPLPVEDDTPFWLSPWPFLEPPPLPPPDEESE